MSDSRDERVWEAGWDGHRDAQARRLAALSLAEKLDWLEEAHALVLRIRGHAAAGDPFPGGEEDALPG